MTDREVWIKAAEILETFGPRAGDHIIDQLMLFPGGPRRIEDWRRVAKAIDAITDAKPQ
jgi:hypothetical protein